MILAREKLLGVDQVSARKVVLGQLLGGCAQELDLSRKNAAKKEEFEGVFMEYFDTNHWKTCLKFVTKTMY